MSCLLIVFFSAVHFIIHLQNLVIHLSWEKDLL